MKPWKPAEEIEGWMSEKELEWLYDRASECSHVVEIGCWKGRSTYTLLAGCSGSVYAVDTWRGSPTELQPGAAHHEALTANIKDIFWKNVGHFSNLHIVQCESVLAAKMFDDYSIDMIFVDGDHTVGGCTADVMAWQHKYKKLFCGHDRNFPGVKAATALVPNLNTGPGSIWFRDKRKEP